MHWPTWGHFVQFNYGVKSSTICWSQSVCDSRRSQFLGQTLPGILKQAFTSLINSIKRISKRIHFRLDKVPKTIFCCSIWTIRWKAKQLNGAIPSIRSKKSFVVPKLATINETFNFINEALLQITDFESIHILKKIRFIKCTNN